MKSPKLRARARARAPFAWADAGMRIVYCALLFVVGYQLVAQSTFAWRLRDDVPSGVGGFALVVAATIGLSPLLTGRKFLGALLASAFVFTAIGAHWWTTIPWEEAWTESNFTITKPPRLSDYALVMTPGFLVVAYVATSRWSRLRAGLLARGIERAEADRAAAVSFLAGGVSLAIVAMMALAFVVLSRSGLFQKVPALLAGAPSVIAAVLLVAAAVRLLDGTARTTPATIRPSGREEGHAGRDQSPGRRWPS